MTSATVIEALALPPDTRVDQRVPKKLLTENGAPTASDKRHIQDGLEELHWLAALKPTNIGIPVFRDTTREYLEIAVLAATLRIGAKSPRIIELIHRAIPYPVVLVATQGGKLTFSVAHKRWSQGGLGKIVVEEPVATSDLSTGAGPEMEFLATLALTAQPRQNLFALYQGWLNRIAALAAARISGAFALAETAEAATARRDALDDHARIQRELATLRAQATKEKQINRRVELNLAIQRLEAESRKLGAAL